MFGKHVNIGLVGYCLGDKEIIDWVLNDPGAFGPRVGGFYAVMDTMIKDGRFWGEAPIYALVYDVTNMLALAEAARHYDGTDLYHWTSKKSGASIKSVIDGYLLMGYPLERTGIGQGRVRLATFGDGGTSFNPSGTMGKDPEDLTNPSYLTVLELAYARYKDPGYAWMLSLPPDRNTLGSIGRSPFGFLALSHGEPLPDRPTPPPAPGGVYASQGFALIRADESPGYWTSGAGDPGQDGGPWAQRPLRTGATRQGPVALPRPECHPVRADLPGLDARGDWTLDTAGRSPIACFRRVHDQSRFHPGGEVLCH